jgi:hypothetical protein
MIRIYEARQSKPKQKAGDCYIGLDPTCFIRTALTPEGLPMTGQVGFQMRVSPLPNVRVAKTVLLLASEHIWDIRQSHVMRIHTQGSQLTNCITSREVSHAGVHVVHRKAFARVMSEHFLIGLIELAEVVILSGQAKGFHEEAPITTVIRVHL